jgi:Concanavalin A-like lectin/glucanases superfamily
MYSPKTVFQKLLCRCGIFLLAASLAGPLAARAGLTIDVHMYANGGGYFCFPFLSTNSAGGPPTDGNTYFAWSPGSSMNSGIHSQLNPDGSFTGTSSSYFGHDFNGFIQAMTNGNWTLLMTNAVTTNQYTFTLGGISVSSNAYALVSILYPTNGASGVSNNAVFAWQGPAGWQGTLTVEDHNAEDSFDENYALDPSETNWLTAQLLPPSTNFFHVAYFSNTTATLIASTPVDASSQPLAGWISTGEMESTADSTFYVGNLAPGPTTSHQLIAYYMCDTSNSDGSASYTDFSGNDNGINSGSNWGTPNQDFFTNDAAVGPGADLFTGFHSVSPPDPVRNSLAGSFSVSVWIKTTQTHAADDDDAYRGAGIVWAYVDGGDDLVPLSMTGNKAAFYTGSTNGPGDTLHSVADVNTGDYVHVVVTRDQQTGVKKIYINGVLDAAGLGSTDLLNEPTNLFDLNVGGYPNGGGVGYIGVLDDLQFYSGVLNPDEVAFIYHNRGATIPDSNLPGGLVAYYNFDQTNVMALDHSGNTNDLVFAGAFQGGAGPTIDTNDSVAGAGSVSFDGNSFLSAPPGITRALKRNFSVSVWVKTTQDYNAIYSAAWDGAAVVSADVPNQVNDVVPIALTGGVVAFNTGGDSDDTLHSSTFVNDDSWHHIVVTRDQLSGMKQIFVDGLLDSSDTRTTNLLNQFALVTIGAKADASDSDPSSPADTGSNGYQGWIDDLQFYSDVLTSNQVAFLYTNPGQVITNGPQPLTWTGIASDDWDAGTTNWSIAGIPTNYIPGDATTFDDSAPNSSVNLTSSLTPSAIVVNGNNQFFDFYGEGNLSGDMSLTVDELNTTTFETPNTYTGVTWVGRGALSLFNNGSISNSPMITLYEGAIIYAGGRNDGTMTLSSGQTLRGNGTINGTLALSGGSIIAPGPTIGELDVSGSILFQGGGRYDVEVQDAKGDPGVGYDTLSASDRLGVQSASGNPFVIHLRSVNANRASGSVTNFNNNTNYTWTIASGTVTNFSATAFALDTGAFSNDLAGGFFYLKTGSLLLSFTNNHPPVAANPAVSRNAGQSIQIPIASLGTDPDGDPVQLLSVSDRGTNGGVITFDSSNVYYSPGTNGNVTDQVAYTIGDVRTNPPAVYRPGDTQRTALGNILITVTGGSIVTTQKVVSVTVLPDRNKRITFSGAANAPYVVQAATNLTAPVHWVNISTNTAGSDGLWNVDDLDSTNHPRRFYRSTGP